MPSSGQNFRPLTPARAPRRAGGFTLFELLLAMLVLGLVSYIAIAEVGKFQHRAQRDQFVADLKDIAAAFEAYHAQKGDWPPATNAEIRIPRGMESALANTRWSAGPPFGGSYDWLPPARVPVSETDAKPGPAKKPAPPGVIAITAFFPSPSLSLSDDDLRYIDAKLDDGDPATGRFRTGFNRWPVYLIETAP
jgi:prepilin-type N-terminal cleavage/methylation domain-containing protein